MAPYSTVWSRLGGRGLNVFLRNPLEAKSQTLISFAGCHQTSGLLPVLSGQSDLVGDCHLPSCPTKSKRRCRAATCKESQPPSNSVMVCSNFHASQVFLFYINGRRILMQSSPFSPCPGASGYTIPHYGRNLVGMRLAV